MKLYQKLFIAGAVLVGGGLAGADMYLTAEVSPSTMPITLSAPAIDEAGNIIMENCPNPAPEQCTPGLETDRCTVEGLSYRGCDYYE